MCFVRIGRPLRPSRHGAAAGGGILPYVTHAYRLEIRPPGRILAGLSSGKHQHLSSGRPMAGRRADFEVFPIRLRQPDEKSSSEPTAFFLSRVG